MYVRILERARNGEASDIFCLARLQSFNHSWSGISHASDDSQVQWSVVAGRIGNVDAPCLSRIERISVF